MIEKQRPSKNAPVRDKCIYPLQGHFLKRARRYYLALLFQWFLTEVCIYTYLTLQSFVPSLNNNKIQTVKNHVRRRLSNKAHIVSNKTHQKNCQKSYCGVQENMIRSPFLIWLCNTACQRLDNKQ
jgi:hypothetical protein